MPTANTVNCGRGLAALALAALALLAGCAGAEPQLVALTDVVQGRALAHRDANRWHELRRDGTSLCFIVGASQVLVNNEGRALSHPPVQRAGQVLLPRELARLIISLFPLTDDPAPAPLRLPPRRQRPPRPPGGDLYGVNRVTRQWRYILVHHSHTTEGNAAIFDDYHRNVKGWSHGLGYHFVIGNGTGSGDGQVEIGHRWTGQLHGAHAGVDEYNQHGIGICLVGDFQHQRPTPAQLRALAELTRTLMRRLNIPRARVLRHGDVKDTQCPGRNFPFASWRNGL